MIAELLIRTISNLFFFALHLSGTGSFPPPLSAKRERECLLAMKNGDVNAKNELIEHNLRLVAHIIKKYYSSSVQQDDLISIGTIGLIKAINTFDPDKGTRLATYAARCIENEILMFLRRNNRVKSEVSIDEPLNQDRDGNELLLSDILGTDEDVIYKNLEDEVDHKLLKIAISKLSDKEKYIMNLRFGMNGCAEKTQKEVADLLGISQSYISRLEKRIMGKMRKEISSKTG